ncbi:MAG: hypothetical protein MJ172_03500 [Clostridia bacterium]|nr:hypothetical protein [Clostridia bacterium]
MEEEKVLNDEVFEVDETVDETSDASVNEVVEESVDETVEIAQEVLRNVEEQGASNKDITEVVTKNISEDVSRSNQSFKKNPKDNTARPNQNSKKDSPDLKTLSFMASQLCYSYSVSLADKGHRLLATEITRLSLDNDYAASFVSGALSRDKFTQSLEEGYYVTGKLYEVLSMIASLGLKQDKHDKLMDLVDRMHRMYAASIRTLQKKMAVPQHFSGL